MPQELLVHATFSAPGGVEAGLCQEERRATTRYPIYRAVAVCPVLADAQEFQPAIISNLSEAGLGLFVFSRFEPDTRLLVEFGDELVKSRLARVVHVTENDNGVMIGCEFAEPFTEAEMWKLREPKA